MIYYRKYADELLKYLASKLPDIPHHTAEEIAAHIANKTGILVADAVRERDSQWKNEMKRQYRK